MQNLIFDLDGTLIDSADSILSSIEITLCNFGYKSDYLLNSDSIGPPLIQTLQNLTGESSEEILNSLADSFKINYDTQMCVTAQPYDGIGDLLKALNDKDKNLLLATNKRLAPTIKILEFLGWRHYFSDVYCIDSSDQNFATKATMINKLIKQNGLSADQTIYFGDRAEDYEAANENSIKFGYAEWGYGKNQSHSNYVYRFSSPKEINKFFNDHYL